MTVWIYEAYETEDYNLTTEIKIFENEEKARAFWEKKKQNLLDTTDTEYFVVEDEGDRLDIYDEESPCEFSWTYLIKEYTVE